MCCVGNRTKPKLFILKIVNLHLIAEIYGAYKVLGTFASDLSSSDPVVEMVSVSSAGLDDSLAHHSRQWSP